MIAVIMQNNQNESSTNNMLTVQNKHKIMRINVLIEQFTYQDVSHQDNMSFFVQCSICKTYYQVGDRDLLALMDSFRFNTVLILSRSLHKRKLKKTL